MRELTAQEVQSVSGGSDSEISGYEGAGAIMTTVAFGSLFTPIGPITAGIALGTAAGLAVSQFIANLDE